MEDSSNKQWEHSAVLVAYKHASLCSKAGPKVLDSNAPPASAGTTGSCRRAQLQVVHAVHAMQEFLMQACSACISHGGKRERERGKERERETERVREREREREKLLVNYTSSSFLHILVQLVCK